MRSRVSLYLNSLTLEEIMFLQEELEGRKERFKQFYFVLSIHSNQSVFKSENPAILPKLVSDMKRYINESATAGSGAMLAYSPDVSVLLFTSVEGVKRTCAALLCNLPEFNGKGGRESYKIGLKLGLASGVDTLAVGSLRSVRSSLLVKRANQCAWKSTVGSLLMDENSYQEWPEKYSAIRIPLEVDGQHTYKVVPGTIAKDNSADDNQDFIRFLNKVVEAGIQTLHYDLESTDERIVGKDGVNYAATKLQLEAYDWHSQQNLIYVEKISIKEYPDRMEILKRMLSSMNLALVKHELSN